MEKVLSVSNIRIEKITAENADDFFSITKKVYVEDPIYVPENTEMIAQQLFADNSHVGAFVAYITDQPVARAATIIATDNQGWIGYFECLKSSEQVGVQLLKYCVAVLQQAGVNLIDAPKASNLFVGLLIKRFNLPHSVLSPHNPPYYKKIFKKAGFKKKEKTFAFYFTRETISMRKFPINSSITTRTFDPSNLEREAEIFHSINMQVFANSYNYVVRTLNEEKQLIKSLMQIIDPNLVIIAEDENKNAVGMLIALPDVNQQLKKEEITQIRIISIAVVPSMHKQRVATTMGLHLRENALKNPKYKYAEASFIFETNIPSKILAMKFNAKPGREFMLYTI